MKKIYSADEHTDIEYAERKPTELEMAKFEIIMLNKQIEGLKEDCIKYQEAVTSLNSELNGIKWTLETIFGGIGNA